jgi:hypothetical protein
MNVTVGGITALDRVKLTPELKAEGVEVEFKEDETAEHGQGDMGIFTIGVPLTYAVAKVLTAWIKSRTPQTKVKVGNITIEKTGKDMTPEDVAKFKAALGEPTG